MGTQSKTPQHNDEAFERLASAAHIPEQVRRWAREQEARAVQLLAAAAFAAVEVA